MAQESRKNPMGSTAKGKPAVSGHEAKNHVVILIYINWPLAPAKGKTGQKGKRKRNLGLLVLLVLAEPSLANESPSH